MEDARKILDSRSLIPTVFWGGLIVWILYSLATLASPPGNIPVFGSEYGTVLIKGCEPTCKIRGDVSSEFFGTDVIIEQQSQVIHLDSSAVIGIIYPDQP
tara:strand:- start:288 stop:587 length:300 start_codon:yes stop_codon:yes gene_type:complete